MKKAQENKSYVSQVILFVLTSKIVSILLLFSFLSVDAKNITSNSEEGYIKFKDFSLIISNNQDSSDSLAFDEFFDSFDEFLEDSQKNFFFQNTIITSYTYLRKCRVTNYCKIPFYILFQQLKLDVFKVNL